MADAYLTETVRNLPATIFFQPDGQLRGHIRAMPEGVVKIAAGPTHCHVTIDIRRPYYRPLPHAAQHMQEATHG